MDRLDEIYNKQQELQTKLGNIDIFLNQKFININLLAMFDEVGEVMRETRWKNPKEIEFGWKKTQEFNVENYRNELVDILHFFMNLCIAGGMTSEELFVRYMNKNKENHTRKEEEY